MMRNEIETRNTPIVSKEEAEKARGITTLCIKAQCRAALRASAHSVDEPRRQRALGIRARSEKGFGSYTSKTPKWLRALRIEGQ